MLHAYRDHCAFCSLKHRELLDAAHILPDNEGGRASVSNGLSLCKIHHAAFDKNILGINEDFRIEVRNSGGSGWANVKIWITGTERQDLLTSIHFDETRQNIYQGQI